TPLALPELTRLAAQILPEGLTEQLTAILPDAGALPGQVSTNSTLQTDAVDRPRSRYVFDFS
ncbi:hypothetical protein ACM7EH_32115, partial [Pseudomonas aeruginosa]